MKTEEFTPAELEELGSALRKSIEVHYYAKTVIVSRLRWNPASLYTLFFENDDLIEAFRGLSDEADGSTGLYLKLPKAS